MTKTCRCLLAALLLGLLWEGVLPGAQARGLTDLPPDAVIVDPLAIPPSDLAAASAVAKQVRIALASGPAAALKVLEGVQDPVRHAHAAAALIADLQAGEGDPAARAVLEELGRTPLRVFRRHEETAADWFLPHVDVAGQARFALRILDARAERARWAENWKADPESALADLHKLNAPARELALEGLVTLPDASADRVLVVALRDAAAQPPSLWPTLAVATGNGAAFDAAATHSGDSDLLRLLPARDRLPPAQSVRWLLELAQRPALASAALLAMTAHAEHGSVAWKRLVEALDEPALAPTAAAALAQRPHADRLTQIVALAQDASSTRLVALALALRLEGSPAALAALDGLREDPRLPAATRAELAR